MTLVFSAAGQLLQGQFGVSEIASAITVGSYVGSIFTRSSDAKIYAALETGYGIFVEKVPEYLCNVEFDRAGTVFGERQRSIRISNTLDGVEIDTLDGIATFVILLLRYVETKDDILTYIKRMLQGEFLLVNGGKLARKKGENVALPYSMKPLKTHINAVLDADADSKQHRLCMIWMIELYGVLGYGKDLAKASQFSHKNYRAFLRELLGGHIDRKAKSVEPRRFDTFSLGTANICLAALANGANVRLTVMTSTGEIQVPKHMPRRTTEPPFQVCLWTKDPPPEISSAMRLDASFRISQTGAEHGVVPIFGGDAELADIVANEFGCTSPSDEIIELWKRAIFKGMQATWEACPRSTYIRAFNIRPSQRFMDSHFDSQLEPLSKIYYSGPRSDRTHLLAHKVAEVYHEVYKLRNYDRIDPARRQEAEKTLNFIAGAFAVGCLKSLISTPLDDLVVFVWTLYRGSGGLDATKLGKLPAAIVTGGLSFPEILGLIGKIWGGLNPHTRFDPEFSGTNQSRGGQVPAVGIVCPHKTILLDVLHSPQKLATSGLDKGIVSVYSGSIPLLPQDPSGIIWASDVHIRQKIVQDNLHHIRDLDGADFVFTSEPLIQMDGKLCIVLCAWKYGDAVFQLNPVDVLTNLVCCRSLAAVCSEPSRDLMMERRGFQSISRVNLYSGLQLPVPMGDLVKVIESDGLVDFQVVCAGYFEAGRMLLIDDKEDAETIRKEEISASDINDIEVVVIQCKSRAPTSCNNSGR